MDKDNNYYFLTNVINFNPQFLGQTITKYSPVNTDTDIYLVSTDCEGNFRWQTTIGGHTQEDYASMALDTLGGVYVALNVTNTSRSNNTNIPPHFAPGVAMGLGVSGPNPNPNNRRLVLVKYDTDGSYLWHHFPQDENVTSTELEGFFWGISQSNSLIAEPNGTLYWHCLFFPGNHLNGQLVVPSSTLQYNAVLRYDKDGNYQGHFQLPLMGGATNYFTKLHRDPTNGRFYFYFANQNASTTWQGDPINVSALFALDSNGNELWRKLSSQAPGSASIFGLTTDNESNVYLTGIAATNSTGTATLAGYNFTHSSSNSPYVIKLNANGDLQWGTNLAPGVPDNSCFNCTGRDLFVHGDQVILAASLNANTWGSLVMPRQFGQGPGPVLMRFDKQTGTPLSLHHVDDLLGLNSTEEFMAVTVDLDGNIIAGGYARSTIFLNHPNIAPLFSLGGDSDFFIAKLGNVPCFTYLNQDSVQTPTFKVYPNPTSDYLFVEGAHLERYELYHSSGRLLSSGKITPEGISLQSFANGVYFLQVYTKTGEKSVEKVVRD